VWGCSPLNESNLSYYVGSLFELPLKLNQQDMVLFHYMGVIFHEWALTHWAQSLFKKAELYQIKWALINKTRSSCTEWGVMLLWICLLTERERDWLTVNWLTTWDRPFLNGWGPVQWVGLQYILVSFLVYTVSTVLWCLHVDWFQLNFSQIILIWGLADGAIFLTEWVIFWLSKCNFDSFSDFLIL